MSEEKRPGVKKDHRKALDEWLERSAKVLDEYSASGAKKTER